MADTCLTAPTLTEVSDCYNTLSITQRITLPSTLSNVSITLEQRLLCSTHCIPHVWSAHVQDSSSLARSTEATYPPQLIAKIFDPVFFNSYDAEYADPFILGDLSVSCEVEVYSILSASRETECHGSMDTLWRLFSSCLQIPQRMCATGTRMLSSMPHILACSVN